MRGRATCVEGVDVSNAYLFENIDREVLTENNRLVNLPKMPKDLRKLWKQMYGIRQAGRE